jgi:hypothetical protein
MVRIRISCLVSNGFGSFRDPAPAHHGAARLSLPNDMPGYGGFSAQPELNHYKVHIFVVLR